jgi:predicted enzyme related to lactoylglutathione lyase
MPARLRHFDINADDVQRGKAFYEKVLGWTIAPTQWPGYLQISIAGVAVGGLQGRRDLINGLRTNTFETSFEVEDIRATLAAAEVNGGKVLMQPSPVGGGGPEVGYFEDPEGNICGVGQYPKPGAPAPPPTFRYFAINADDVQRGKAFYEKVFGWTFTPWGPPDYYQVKTAGMFGALQERRDLINGVRTNAFEPTFQVEDIVVTLAAAVANGGKKLMQPYFIEGVGDIGYFQDTEGNIVGVGQYLPGTGR